MQQRLFAAVCHPHFGGINFGDRGGQFIPIGVIGNHQRQFDAALHRALPHPHPAAGHGRDRIGQAAAPAVVQCRWRCDDDMTSQRLALQRADRPQITQRHAVRLIEVAQRRHGAVQIDGRIMAGAAQFRDQPLCLAQRIGAHQDTAIGIGRQRGQQPRHLGRGIGMAEHRQAKGGFGDEDIAFQWFERRAGGIGAALVIT